MCTVSFYRDQRKVIITSNRDENINRPLAIAPQIYHKNNLNLYYPIDPQSGGTWFIVNEFGHTFVLLNGAEYKHISNPPYQLSRGIVLLNIAAASDFEAEWNSIDLINIEPFTIVAFKNNTLFQLRWNGNEKDYKLLDGIDSKIWSSATLYEPEVIQQRATWFDEFISKKEKPIDADDFISFHTLTQCEDLENGVIINRNNGTMLTKNVTQLTLESDRFSILHLDLIQNEKTILKGQIR